MATTFKKRASGHCCDIFLKKVVDGEAENPFNSAPLPR
ncbi:hypothetical protein C942_01095 [Photobacterium marinum]|uniref:Uncharacterized protein n=1 Tax=Photobacterium marinum TaxID=1056511 RepID=L8JAS1_9GAMM|nr:hypothetical protein C942_01095 [Photobacterium marinum]